MDWTTLMSRMPVDGDQPERRKRIMALQSVLEGTQYDVLTYAFSEEKTGGGEYVKLDNRRPSVKTHLCRTVVDDAVSVLFGEKHWPALVGQETTVRALNDLIKHTMLNHVMIDAATRGSVGSVLVVFRVIDNEPRFEVVSTANLIPEWNRRDHRKLIRVTDIYKVSREDLEALGYVNLDQDCKRFWFCRTWDDRFETWYKPLAIRPGKAGEIKGRPPSSAFELDEAFAHGLDRFPGVWIRNLSDTAEPDGECVFEKGIDTVIEVDYLLSQCGRGLKYSSDPTLVLKAGPDDDPDAAGPITMGGAATAIELPPEGDAKLLEINGQSAKAVLEHVRELRTLALEAMHGNRAHADLIRVAQSGRAMEMLMTGLIWLADRLRLTYGEYALLELLRIVCLASSKRPLKILDQTYENLDHSGLQLRWPSWIAPTYQDGLTLAQATVTAVEGGVMSRLTAIQKMSEFTDLTDFEAEEELIAQDTDVGEDREVDVADRLATVQTSHAVALSQAQPTTSSTDKDGKKTTTAPSGAAPVPTAQTAQGAATRGSAQAQTIRRNAQVGVKTTRKATA